MGVWREKKAQKALFPSIEDLTPFRLMFGKTPF